jgi:hypothetical protein
MWRLNLSACPCPVFLFFFTHLSLSLLLVPISVDGVLFAWVSSVEIPLCNCIDQAAVLITFLVFGRA